MPPASAYAGLAARAAEARVRWPKLGWVPPERWHLTLAFLGEVDDESVARLDAPFAAVATAHPSLRLMVEGVGTFPAAGRPRVVWAGIAGDVESVGALARDVSTVAATVCSHVDTKPFRAHLTVARARREPVDDAAPLLADLDFPPGPPFVATEVVLFRSELGPRPRYTRLAAYPLGHQE